MTVGVTQTAKPVDSVKQITLLPLNGEFITPSDTDDYTQAVAVTVYGAGDISFWPYERPLTEAATVFTVTADQAANGFELPSMVRRVRATNTTATLIWGAW